MNWKRSFLTTAAVGGPLIALLAYGMTRDPRDIPSPLPGRDAPTFARAAFVTGDHSALRVPVGDTVRLHDLRGRVVVVNFWASWCLACRGEHSALSETARAYADKGVRFFGMLYNDSEANGRDWIAEMGGQPYPALSDPGARAAIAYGLYGVPESFVIGADGRVAYKFIGAVNEPQLHQLIDSLLAVPTTTPGTRDTRSIPVERSGAPVPP